MITKGLAKKNNQEDGTGELPVDTRDTVEKKNHLFGLWCKRRLIERVDLKTKDGISLTT